MPNHRADPRAPVQLLNPVTLPIWPIDDEGYCTCHLGGECKDPGKHPRPYQKALEGGGYGIYCGSRGGGHFVVDLDVKEKDGRVINGVENFRLLCEQHGEFTVIPTLIVRTGGGGLHLYFQSPGFPVKSLGGALGAGIDVKGEGGWVVGPGSTHRSGESYEVVRPDDIAPCPPWLAALLPHEGDLSDDFDGEAWPIATIDAASDEGQHRIGLYRTRCRGEGPQPFDIAVSGARGSARIKHVAKIGAVHYRLPAETVADVMATEWNPRCDPPWSEGEIARAVRNAIRTHHEPDFGLPPQAWGDRLVKRFAAQGTDRTVEATPERRAEVDRLLTEGPSRASANEAHEYSVELGRDVPNQELKTSAFSLLVFKLTRTPEWDGVLQWDLLRQRVLAVNPPIRLECETQFNDLTEVDVSAIRAWLEIKHGVAVAKTDLRDAIVAAARQTPFHPLQDYILSLPPGDPALLDDLAARWFGDRRPIVQRLLKMFLVGAVRRAMEPGTQVDTMLVLYDPKGGTGKTDFVDALFSDEFTTHQVPSLEKAADASSAVAKKWCAELGELATILRASHETVLDFLSRRVDECRYAYGRGEVRTPRSCAFIGTTNRPEIIQELGGARRFLVISIPQGWRIDRKLVRTMRDRVWGAAWALAQTDFAHWIENDSEEAIELEDLQRSHLQLDAWHEDIVEYITGRDIVRTPEIYRDVVMRGEDCIERKNVSAIMRIAKTLRILGCTPGETNDAKGHDRFWSVPASLSGAEPTKREAIRRSKGRILSLVPKSRG